MNFTPNLDEAPDFGTALATETTRGALVALRVGGVGQGCLVASSIAQRRYSGPCLGQRVAAVAIAGLIRAWTEPSVAAELLR